VKAFANRPEAKTVALLLSSDPVSPDSGTGLILFPMKTRYWVLTCDHVVRSWASENNAVEEIPQLKLFVNDKMGKVVFSGMRIGIDLALVEVEGPPPPNTLNLTLREYPRTKEEVFGFGYTHLAQGDYVRELFMGTVGLPISLQRRGNKEPIPAWVILPKKGHKIEPGQSGSPLFTSAGELAGIISHQREDHGFAIAGQSIRAFICEAEKKLGIKLLHGAEKNAKPPKLQIPDKPDDPDDLNKGRFKGRSSSQGRRLSAQVYPSKSKDYFYADFTIRSTDGSKIESPVYFYLHESFPQPTIRMTKTNENGKEIILEDVYSEGSFTVGAQVKDKDGKWIPLELDLSSGELLPRALRNS
jgi:hypothetical protein